MLVQFLLEVQFVRFKIWIRSIDRDVKVYGRTPVEILQFYAF